jgi:hypothetical protein
MLCKDGTIMRKAYTRKGTRVPAHCIRSVSPYGEKYRNFQERILKKMTKRLRGIGKTKRGNTQKCKSGQILRKSYVRYSKTGKRTLVKGTCITKQGKSEIPLSKQIGPLRKGELSQFGYTKIIDLSQMSRHIALKKAISAFGSLSVWKKINALYVLTKNTNPTLSKKYNEDRNWIRTTFGLKASSTVK